MSIVSIIQYYYFKQFQKPVHNNRYHAVECQQRVLSQLVRTAKQTAFGKEHRFGNIKSYHDFKMQVPLRDYAAFKPYIRRILSRDENVLWPGLPAYFGKSTGTTDASKYLPVTKEFLRCTQYAAKYMLCNLVLQQKHADFIGKKVFYLDDTQPFEDINGFKCAAISAIKSSRIPGWAKSFSFPGKSLDHIHDAEQKLNAIIDTMPGNDIRMAVALPVWLSHFLQAFEKRNGQKFKEAFPLFKTVFLSGMNYEPYEQLMREHMGTGIMIMENYTATEGNFAYQPVPGIKGMELICNQGIFYEFIPIDESGNESIERLMLQEVEEKKKYALIISNNSGLWAYKMNDIVEFVSKDPYRIAVCGRLHNIFSPFGEHLLPVQADQAVAATAAATNCIINDFLIVPDFTARRYKCYIEFWQPPSDIKPFQVILEKNLCAANSYFNELLSTHVINAPEIIPVSQGFFSSLRNTEGGKINAQSKVNHLSLSDHTIAKAAQIFS